MKENHMQTLWLPDRQICYDGTQLAPHWIYRHFDLMGDAAVAFVGPCQVALSEMVDIADVKAQAPISSPLMLHIIAEFFTGDLHLTVYRQRLLIIHAKEILETRIGQPLTRQGDDLYVPLPGGTPGKLSVSIATTSTVSTLIHTGFNIATYGTPVPTSGLAPFGVDTAEFARTLLQCYAHEMHDIWMARCKVRAVHHED
jgi:hypothetical protein